MLEDDIKRALNIIAGNRATVFDQIYSFTNENIKGCFNHFDFKNKDVLSVLASSDQVFDMFLRGANKIDTFDINPLTKYYFYLKKVGIKTFTKREFVSFFSCDNSKFFDKDMFSEIAKYLKGDSYIFWNTLFDHYYSGKIFYELSNLFIFEYIPKIPYLSDCKKYELLQRKIDLLDVKFINCDIYDLINILDNKYDIIYLSNILGRLGLRPYYFSWEGKEIVEKMLPFLQKLSEFLKDDGEIIANYFYKYSQVTQMLKSFKNSSINTSHFEKIKFKHGKHIYEDDNTYAGELIYRK